jgi:hypothetical protein
VPCPTTSYASRARGFDFDAKGWIGIGAAIVIVALVLGLAYVLRH